MTFRFLDQQGFLGVLCCIWGRIYVYGLHYLVDMGKQIMDRTLAKPPSIPPDIFGLAKFGFNFLPGSCGLAVIHKVYRML